MVRYVINEKIPVALAANLDVFEQGKHLAEEFVHEAHIDRDLDALDTESTLQLPISRLKVAFIAGSSRQGKAFLMVVDSPWVNQNSFVTACMTAMTAYLGEPTQLGVSAGLTAHLGIEAIGVVSAS